MRIKASLETTRAGIPNRNSDKKMNDRSAEYNRARRDVQFNQDKLKVAEDKADVIKERLLVEQSKGALQGLAGEVKSALAMLQSAQSNAGLGALPGVGAPANMPQPLPMSPGGGLPMDMPSGPLPAGQDQGMPPGVDPNMMPPGITPPMQG